MTGQNLMMNTGSFTYKIYKFIVRKRAVISSEIAEEFKDTPLQKHHVSSYLKQLLKNELIVKSTDKVQSKNRMCSRSFVYGLSEEDIRRKIESFNKSIDTEDLLVGIKAKVFEIFQNNRSGLTLAEVFYQLKDYPTLEDYANWDYTYQCIRELFTAGKINRSEFSIPATEMIHGRKPGYVYGKDEEAIRIKVLDLMPKQVRTAYLDIIQSNEIYPIDVLKEKYKIEEEVIKSWFVYRLASVSWVKVFSYKQRRYYYNPSRPENLIAELVPKIHQKEVVRSILDNSTLGFAFEEQAIFYFVMYLIKRYKLQVRLNADFPKKIPSWFNKDHIHKYTDEKGKRLVDVWKFDNDPIDYLIYVYDDIMDVPIMGYAVSIKRDKKGKYLGMAGKKYITSMIGCMSQGFSYDMRKIPQFNSLKPVLIMNNPMGIKLFDWARQTGCLLLYAKKVERIIAYCNAMGIQYHKDKQIKDLHEETILLERYENHEDVIVGKCKAHDLVKKQVEVRLNETEESSAI
ncbi:hypothetical protein K9M74_01080 [Candidatus Woesearchaeota archaeon]|nr:hypothetical protein [Candidatus Woesearchaeota archaeon]